MLLNDSTLVRLSRGVHILQRDDTAVQFGVDATRSGLIESPVAPALSRTLNDVRWPEEIGALRATLKERCGTDEVAAQSLIDDLCAYRILIPAAEPTVAVMGSSPLAREITRILRASGAAVRIPTAREDVEDFLQRYDRSPLVLVDSPHNYFDCCKQLAHHRNWCLPVISFDSRVIVGPVSAPGSSPCAMCMYMQLGDRDELLHRMMETIAEHERRADPVVTAMGAAVVVTVMRRLMGVADPPGIVPDKPEPGSTLMVDPFGPVQIMPFPAESHPKCPVCSGS